MAERRKTKKRKEDFGQKEEIDKPSKEEYAVAKWLKSNVPTKKTKFLNHHVEYFTGSKAVDALLASKWATGKSPLFTERIEVVDFLHEMLLHKFFHRARKVPVSEQELKGRSKKKDADKATKKDEETKENKDGEKIQTGEGKETKEVKEKEKRKRKIRVDMHSEQLFVDGLDAYVWIYDPIPMHYWLAGFAVVLGSIGICMFPLWPPTVRKGVYYLSIAAAGFLVLIIALATLRLVVFCLVWILTLSRHHLWLLPNLTEDVGFFASFWPLYKYEYNGPTSKDESSSKSKKKRKKEKVSDDEAEEKKPLTEEQSSKEQVVKKPEDTGGEIRQRTNRGAEERQTESESESSQRSSTGKDFEMVDAGDVDTS